MTAATDGRPAGANPYVGPRAFTRGETIYGRDRELQRLLHLLIAERIVALYSPSGAGKTSLIQAGLMPLLEQEEFAVLPVIRVGLEPPSVEQGQTNRYVHSTILSLEEGQPADQRIPLDELANLDLPTYLDRRCTSATEDGTTEWVLIFDQFEEILTSDPTDESVKSSFFAQIGAALRDRRLWALFALREDYLAGLDPYLRPIPTRLHTTFRLDLLSPESARVAIQQPARAFGVDFDETAAKRLIDDLRRVRVQQLNGAMLDQPGAYVEPVQLQVVCRRLWDRLPSGTSRIVESDIEAVGDVDEALAGYYADRMASVAGQTGVPERGIREWVDRHLITENGIRGQVLEAPDESEGLSNTAILALVDAHLVRAERRRGFTWFELAHDRLIGPVRADNTKWFEQHLSELQRHAAMWNQHDRRPELLLRGKAYQDARAWADAHARELTPVEQDFMAAARELDEAVARDRRRVQWIQRLAVGALLLAILTTGASVLAFDATRRATDAQSVTEQQAEVASQQGLVAQARDHFAGQLDLGLLLGVAAVRVNNTMAAHVADDRRYALLEEARAALLDGLYFEPRLTRFLRPVAGSPARARGLAFSPDGTTLFSVADDDTLRVWDVASGAERPEAMITPLGGVRVLAFSRDRKNLATLTSTGMIRLWDTDQHVMVNEWDPHHTVTSLAFSSNGSLLASGGCTAPCKASEIKIWDLAGPAPPGPNPTLPVLEPSGVPSLAFSPNGNLLVAGGRTGTILRWTVGTWREQASQNCPPPGTSRTQNTNCSTTRLPTEPIETLAFDSTSQYLAVATDNPIVYVYNLNDLPHSPSPLNGHGLTLTSLAFGPKTRLTSASSDGSIIVWDVGEKEQANPPPLVGHNADVWTVAFSSDDTTLASAGTDGAIRLWNVPRPTGAFLRAPEPLGTRLPNPTAGLSRATNPGVRMLAFSSDGQRLAGVFSNLGNDNSNLIGLWKLDGLAPGNPALAGTTADGLPFSADLTPGQGRVEALAFSPDGALLATAGCTNTAESCTQGIIRFWSPATHEPTDPPLTLDSASVTSLAFSPDGKSHLLASGATDGSIHFWDYTSRSELGIPAHAADASVRSLAFSPDGATLASATDDKRLELWNVATREQTSVLQPAPGANRLAFSDDGSFLAAPCALSSDCAPGDISVWNVASGQKLQNTSTGQNDLVNAVTFTLPQTKLLAAVSADGTLRLWDVATQQPVGQSVLAYPFAVDGLAFNAQTGRLATSSSTNFNGGSANVALNDHVVVWSMQFSDWAKAACTIANRNLSLAEWTQYLGTTPYMAVCPEPGEGAPQ